MNGYQLIGKSDTELYYYMISSDTRGTNLSKLDISTGQSTVVIKENKLLAPLFSSDRSKVLYLSFTANAVEFPSIIDDLINQSSTKMKYVLNPKHSAWTSDSKKIISILESNSTKYLYIYDVALSKETTLVISDTDDELNELADFMISSDNKKLYFTANRYLYSIDLL